MPTITVRTADLDDLAIILQMMVELWPDADEDDQESYRLVLSGESPGILPSVLLVAEQGEYPVGVYEICLRSTAAGTDHGRPVGYLEGWYVRPDHRQAGVGRALLAAGERWAAEQGCTEMASDAELDNLDSHRAHEALGFEEQERVVLYSKPIVTDAP